VRRTNNVRFFFSKSSGDIARDAEEGNRIRAGGGGSASPSPAAHLTSWGGGYMEVCAVDVNTSRLPERSPTTLGPNGLILIIILGGHQDDSAPPS
jgi:hypothetical protein